MLRFSAPDLFGESLDLSYVPIKEVIKWSDNPKKHDFGAIITSIETNGFRDPSAFDETLNGLVEGNGRAEALIIMQKQGKAIPRGILTTKEGDWCMPILFGINSKSAAMAARYAIDHNNLTMLGGDFSLHDVAKMWERDGYIKVLEELAETNTMPVSMDFDDLSALIAGNSGDEFEEKIYEKDEADELNDDYWIKIQLAPELYERWIQATFDFGKDDLSKLAGLLNAYEELNLK